MQLFQQSETTASLRRLSFHIVDATNGLDAETGQTGTGFLSKNGGAAVTTTNSLVEINATQMPGRYYIEFTQAELDTNGFIEFRFKSAATAEVVARGQVTPNDPYELIADTILKRGLVNVEGTAESRSLAWAVAKLVNRIRVSGGNLLISETDDTATFFQQAVITDATADPITELDTT